VESSHRGLRQRVATLALEVVVSKSETQGQLSGCEEQSGRTWSSLYLKSRDNWSDLVYREGSSTTEAAEKIPAGYHFMCLFRESYLALSAPVLFHANDVPVQCSEHSCSTAPVQYSIWLCRFQLFILATHYVPCFY